MGQVFVKKSNTSADWSQAIPLRGPPGADGADGADGTGAIVGGAVGQINIKASITDFDAPWSYLLPASLGAEANARTFTEALGLGTPYISIKERLRVLGDSPEHYAPSNFDWANEDAGPHWRSALAAAEAVNGSGVVRAMVPGRVYNIKTFDPSIAVGANSKIGLIVRNSVTIDLGSRRTILRGWPSLSGASHYGYLAPVMLGKSLLTADRPASANNGEMWLTDDTEIMWLWHAGAWIDIGNGSCTVLSGSDALSLDKKVKVLGGEINCDRGLDLNGLFPAFASHSAGLNAISVGDGDFEIDGVLMNGGRHGVASAIDGYVVQGQASSVSGAIGSGGMDSGFVGGPRGSVTLRNNRVVGAYDKGFYMSGSDQNDFARQIIENNHITRCVSGMGFMRSITNCRTRDNVIYECGKGIYSFGAESSGIGALPGWKNEYSGNFIKKVQGVGIAVSDLSRVHDNVVEDWGYMLHDGTTPQDAEYKEAYTFADMLGSHESNLARMVDWAPITSGGGAHVGYAIGSGGGFGRNLVTGAPGVSGTKIHRTRLSGTNEVHNVGYAVHIYPLAKECIIGPVRTVDLATKFFLDESNDGGNWLEGDFEFTVANNDYVRVPLPPSGRATISFTSASAHGNNMFFGQIQAVCVGATQTTNELGAPTPPNVDFRQASYSGPNPTSGQTTFGTWFAGDSPKFVIGNGTGASRTFRLRML